MSTKTPQHYNNSELELTVNDIDYTVDVTAHGIYTHIPGRRYMPNGDPGYPDEDDFELGDVEAVWHDIDGQVVEPDDEMIEALNDYLEKDAGWEDDDPPEPDYDYYEEAAIARYEAECARMGY